MTFSRTTTINWQGSIMEGGGTLAAGTGAFSTKVTFPRRIGEPEGSTSPEELIAAAHASCFSMALSLFLGNAGMTAESIDTKATVTLEQVDGAFTVTSSHLETAVRIPGADAAKFQEAAEGAKAGCPISRLLKTNITLDAKLV